jgi:isoleucyl-tRNA synthetase
VLSFYELYAQADTSHGELPGEPSGRVLGMGNPGKARRENVSVGADSQNILDLWILSRLNQLNREVTAGLEAYELDGAARPFADFIDDLSTWYLRRSRDRFKADATDVEKSDKAAALSTTRSVLLELSKLLAPFMPFVAEDIYLKLRGGLESVHLEAWPPAGSTDASLLETMKEVRHVSSLGLEARSKAQINVRQPLQKLKVKSEKLKGQSTDFLELIQNEINVKETIFEPSLANDVELDTNISKELQEEGALRELLRAVQDARKAAGLSISDLAVLTISAEGFAKEFIECNKAALIKSASLKSITYGDVPNAEKISAGGYSFAVAISAKI